MRVWTDEKGRVHIDWTLDGVTSKMLNWWWCNMEKGFALWHPEEHKDFYWIKRPKHNAAIGAIHMAPQVWSDGTLIKPCIRWEDVKNLPEEIKSVIVFDHVVVAAAISITGEEVKEDAPPIGYRVHQWEKTDFGVRGRSTAIPTKAESNERLLNVWAPHCQKEIANFQVFLPQLYRLWSVVKDPEVNPYFSFKTVREDNRIRYECEAKENSSK
ncbi:MAG: hypothetical protein QW222_01300 [Candidatus Bathyarchaeia archaeon]